MTRRFLILMALTAFVMAGRASAVKSVPRSNDKTAIENQKPDASKGSSDQKATPSEPSRKAGDARQDSDKRKEDSRPEQVKKPSDDSGQKDRIKERDRFIDENDDGLNDRYKKPPEKVKRKKESDDQSKPKTTRERRDR